jgi:hypothetical protein
MPWGVAASVAGAAISSAMAPSTGSSSAGPAYIPYNQTGLDQSFNQYYGQYGNTLGSYYGQVSPLATSLLNNQYNNPNNASYLYGSQVGQNAYYGAGNQALAAGSAEFGLGNQLANAASSWGLNGTELQQLQAQAADTANAQSYLRGTQNSPYGAAVATNAIDQTNLAYAQQQAATQANLAGAATGAYGAASQQYGQGAGSYATGAALPYQAQQNIYSGQNQALQNYYGNSTGNYLQGLNQLQGNALQYLGYGNTAQNTAANQAVNSAQLQQQQAAGLTQGLSSAAANIGQYFGSTPNYGFSTGSSMYSNPGSYNYYGTGTFGY